jgi:hypothetical protein
MSATFPAKSPATFVIVAIASAVLFVTALITGYGIPLFLVTRHRAFVHRPPSTLPLLVDCCLFTPASPPQSSLSLLLSPPPQP